MISDIGWDTKYEYNSGIKNIEFAKRILSLYIVRDFVSNLKIFKSKNERRSHKQLIEKNIINEQQLQHSEKESNSQTRNFKL